MFIEDFIEELRGRYQPYGNLCIVTTTNLPGCSEPRYDEVWLHEHKRSGIKVRLVDLHAQYPTVVIDVSSHPSLTYPLGTATSEVMQKANQGYPNMPQELKSIEQYSNIILDAYTTTRAYDKAIMLFSQYKTTDKAEFLQKAYQTLKDLNLYNPKSVQLLNTIKKLKNIDWDNE